MININSVKIGDRVNCKPFPWVAEANITWGTVVFIDEKKRFFTVEFVTALGKKIRESYSFYGPQTITASKTR